MSESRPSAEATAKARGIAVYFTAADLVILLGMVTVVAGVALVYVPAAIIIGGAALVLIGARGIVEPAAVSRDRTTKGEG